MIEDSKEPRKFRDGPADDDAASRRLQQLFAGLPTAGAPPKYLFARISARIGERSGSRWIRYALPFGAVIAAGAAAAYVGMVSAAHRGTPAPAVQAPLPSIPAVAPPAVTVVPPSPPSISPAIPVATEKTEVQLPAPTKRRTVPAGALPTSRPTSEAEVLAKAMRTLRQEGNSREALSLLGGYFQAFPNGELHGEAQLAEVEALLNLDRSDEALQRLTPDRIGVMPRAPELFALRGELLVKRGRCAEALKAFAEAEARSSEDVDILERTRRGRAACEAKSGGANEPAE